MISKALRWGGGLLAAAALSCSSSQPKSVSPQIPTGGDTATVKSIAGRWEGTYTNPQNGRTGTIVLEFFKGNETHGDILMIPPGSKQAKPSPEETLRTMPRVLEINFIEAGGPGQLNGAVGPYEDPDTHCQSHSEFFGTVKGEVIEGTFRTQCDDKSAPATSGTWLVQRKHPG